MAGLAILEAADLCRVVLDVGGVKAGNQTLAMLRMRRRDRQNTLFL